MEVEGNVPYSCLDPIHNVGENLTETLADMNLVVHSSSFFISFANHVRLDLAQVQFAFE